jgi:ABC-type sugar transport system permease subunit
MATAEEIARAADRRDIRNRWYLSAPAMLTIFFAAVGPLAIVLVYSFLTPGSYGSSRPRPGSRCCSSATSSTTRCRSPVPI